MGAIHVGDLYSGPRLFEDGAAPVTLSLVESRSYDNGVLYLSYRSDA